MTAFTTLLNALFLPGKPILGSTGSALRDNLLSALEGDPTAPRVQPAAMANYIAEVNHSNTTAVVVDIDFSALYLRIDLFAKRVGGASSQVLRMRASSNGGVTWGAYTTIAGMPAGDFSLQGMLLIKLATGAFRLNAATIAAGVPDAATTTGTISVAAGTNALAFSFDGTSGTPTGNHLVAYMGHGA